MIRGLIGIILFRLCIFFDLKCTYVLIDRVNQSVHDHIEKDYFYFNIYLFDFLYTKS